MLVRSLTIAAALLVLAPALVLAQPRDPSTDGLPGTAANPKPVRMGKTAVSGRVEWGDGSVTVNGVKVTNEPFLTLLRPLNGKYVTLKGTVSKGDVTNEIKVATVNGTNEDVKSTTPVLILASPDAKAAPMGTIALGDTVNVTGQTKDGAWLTVKIEEDGGYSETGYVKASELTLGGSFVPGTNAGPSKAAAYKLGKGTLSGPLAVKDGAVTVNGVKVQNEPFVSLLAGLASGTAPVTSVSLDGFVVPGVAVNEVKVSSVTGFFASTRAKDTLKIREEAKDGSNQLGAPVKTGEPIKITGVTKDGKWYTTVVAEGDMRETGYIKVSDISFAGPATQALPPRAPSDTKGVNRALGGATKTP